jgi:cardiolipin synthase (CMP-forming)
MPEQQPQTQAQWFLKPSRYGLTPANGVTAVRLVLVPFIAIALWEGRYNHAFWMTVIAGASDAVDGYIARAFGHKSRLGAYLDPAADKLLILTLFGLLTYQEHLPLWLAALVLARDIAIVATVAVFTRMKKADLRMQPLFVSKLTTFAQLALLIATLADLAFGLDWGDLRMGLVWAVVAFTVASWAAYFVEALRALRTVEAAPGA